MYDIKNIIFLGSSSCSSEWFRYLNTKFLSKIFIATLFDINVLSDNTIMVTII